MLSISSGNPMKHHYKRGDLLICNVEGGRRIRVTKCGRRLWAIPLLKNDGFKPILLTHWLNSIAYPARKLRKNEL
jgi:hypothetical protein